MGTRGFVGFVAGGTEKIAYNHCDSHPDSLGLDTLGWLRGAIGDMAALKAKAAALRVVDPDSKPTDEDIERLKGFANTRVSTRQLDDWYVLLRETQGNPGAMLAAGVIEDAGRFPLDSLFAEYGYLVDTDAEAFEAYRGFQHGPHTKGRFAGRPLTADCADGYFPCALVASWPFSALPTDDEFEAAFESRESE